MKGFKINSGDESRPLFNYLRRRTIIGVGHTYEMVHEFFRELSAERRLEIQKQILVAQGNVEESKLKIAETLEEKLGCEDLFDEGATRLDFDQYMGYLAHEIELRTVVDSKSFVSDIRAEVLEEATWESFYGLVMEELTKSGIIVKNPSGVWEATTYTVDSTQVREVLGRGLEGEEGVFGTINRIYKQILGRDKIKEMPEENLIPNLNIEEIYQNYNLDLRDGMQRQENYLKMDDLLDIGRYRQ